MFSLIKLIVALLAPAVAGAQVNPDWTAPQKPFRIYGNTYYVGSHGLSSILITSPNGHVLIDATLAENVPMIEQHIRELGFRVEDVKIMLSSHAHSDHVGGHARMKALTGARVLATAPDAALMRAGGGGPLALQMTWPPVAVDGELADGEAVTLGGTTMVAHLTPGHTPGATTWTMTVDDAGKPLHVVFFSSSSLFAETPLYGNAYYPRIVEDFEKSYAFWHAVPCDVFLAPHVGFFRLSDKRARQVKGETPNPFIDPAGYTAWLTRMKANFDKVIAEQQ